MGGASALTYCTLMHYEGSENNFVPRDRAWHGSMAKAMSIFHLRAPDAVGIANQGNLSGTVGRAHEPTQGTLGRHLLRVLGVFRR